MKSFFMLLASAYTCYMAYVISTSEHGGWVKNIWLEPWQGYFLYVLGVSVFLCEIIEIKKRKNSLRTNFTKYEVSYLVLVVLLILITMKDYLWAYFIFGPFIALLLAIPFFVNRYIFKNNKS